jgi:hypothetical protein
MRASCLGCTGTRIKSVANMRFKLYLLIAFLIFPLRVDAQVDTVSLLKRAKDAQRKFEQIHRNAMPSQLGGETGRGCDAIIGRICYWNDTADIKQPEEPSKITKTRFALVDTLERIQALLPKNDWLLGQLVSYQVRAGKAAAASKISGGSRRWWLLALRGYANHSRNAFELADNDFAEALKLMPVKTRCEWTDLSLLLPKDQRKTYSKIPCGNRDYVNDRIWLLADPLYSIPGNERRTAHYSRLVMNMIQRDAEPTQDMRWGRDMEEVWLRYGPPTYYTRSWVRSMEGNSSPITGQDAARNYHYLPDAIPYSEAQMKEAARWSLTAVKTEEGYTMPLARRMFQITPQVAVFNRGDSSLVVAAVRPDRKLDVAALVNDRGILTDLDSSETGLSSFIPTRAQLLGLEILDSTNSKTAGRYRIWWQPSKYLSDILIFDPKDSTTVAEPEQAVRLMRPSLTARIVKCTILIRQRCPYH